MEPLNLKFDLEDVRFHFASSKFLSGAGLATDTVAIRWSECNLDFRGLEFTSYHASVLSDFLRRQALNARRSFSFETVMSAEDKVELLREAQARGYRTDL